ncbi:MAG: hypothetical protein HY508_13550 [Acidobacteria bacterium]|nr:hypothetical protein [Acidobacteriota bacterium]
MKKFKRALIILAAVMLAVGPMYAGSAIIGSVAGSKNATIDGQALVPNTTVFSGDSLRVKDGAAVVAVGRGSRLVFGEETVASFLREGTEVTVLLGQGNVLLYQGQAGVNLAVKVGSLRVAPTGGYKTLGEIAMLNGAVVVKAREGKLRVEGNGPAVEVVKGKTITVKEARTAGRAPQGGAAVGGATALQVGSVAGSGVSAVLGGVAAKKAGDAQDQAKAATTAAQNAQQEAEAATTAAESAGEAANAAGCALDTITDTSEYLPPTGFTCP